LSASGRLCYPRFGRRSAVSPVWLTISVERPRDQRLKDPYTLAAVRSNAWVDDPRTDNGWLRLVLWSLNGGFSLVLNARKAAMAGPVDGRPLQRQAPGQAWSARAPQRSPEPRCTPHRSLAGSPLGSHGRSLAHATCSHPIAAGGGAPARGMRAVHTRRRPQTGQHSGCASPRAAHARCQSPGWGTSTGPWPSC
jgi:hypothetical protein